MHLPVKTPAFNVLAVNALSMVAETEARLRAQAREWLLPEDFDSAPAASRAKLTQAQFADDQTGLLGAWKLAAVTASLTTLQFTMEAEGFTPGRVRDGSRVSRAKCLGRYLSVDVKDPVMGNFVARLWLLADWDTGLELVLGAYRPVKIAHALKYPAEVSRNLIAKVSLATMAVDWQNLTLDEAKTRIWDWQEQMLEPGAVGSIGNHWPTVRAARDAALAP